ncbi:MBL fold metallo-hydrolase [Nakamurella flavida]|uniref:MBL fold metallo-hydrolase n=1 Tax=Nakamurella flavida TaxID=363630 RepID=A0A938YMZ3_9ACTN|nr:MBL fold metallo-hydrolase [Nakamurella flavida]MBM9476337.1 MBL fold metallo-hydrolase [Nakamurella flavida]MDP9779563.1 glyoxylase-like metal-dependent hydrolase (beta-lactamase superfamily II) [Nakamurella flavida]
MAARIDKIVTSGAFELDGGSWDVENNVWLVGDDAEVLVIDAAHDAREILTAVGDRRVVGIFCTHAHNDHVNAAPALADATRAPIMLHPAGAPLWGMAHTDRRWDWDLADGQEIEVAGVRGTVLLTPGHAPGAVCLSFPDLGVVFTGDTLFQGGPGATGRSFSDFPTIIDSISTRLLTLPPQTVVHTGHGGDTTIGDEAPQLDEWVVRGH